MGDAPWLIIAFAPPGVLAEPALRDAATAVLDDRERARLARFHFARDRELYLTMHALQRCLLSAVTGAAPASWRFGAGPQGKPHVLGHALHINGSHCHGLTMCAVAGGATVGVDVEPVRDDVPLEVADRFFAPAEQAAIRAAAEPARAFLTSWTLKESYMKARGLGMTLPLDQFAIALGSPPLLHVEPAWQDGIAWQLEVLRPTPDHIAAVCHDAPGARLTVRSDTAWLDALQ